MAFCHKSVLNSAMHEKCVIRLLLCVVAFLCQANLSKANEPPRAVFELFTSQGCSSCPPADRLLTAYAHENANVIALTYPVTIWDYLGWRDTLARPENTERQKSYAVMRGDSKIYTPQMVINGFFDAVGSDQNDIEKKCRLSKEGAALSIPILAEGQGGSINVSIGAWPGKGEPPRARVFLVSYAKERNVPIKAGENAGMTTTYSNVVQSMQEVAYWSGAHLDLRFFWKPAPGQGGAVILQNMSRQGPGVIYGAAMLP
jgi:hypothetical protein